MTRIVLNTPLAGWACPLAEVPDPVFAERMMGDGLAIEPTEGVVRAPCDALVVGVAPTSHSVTLRIADAVEVLIHVGIDTVALAGAGFTAHVAVGDRVRADAVLLDFDLDIVAARAPSLITPVIVVSEGATVEVLARDRLVGWGDPLLALTVAATVAVAPPAGDEAIHVLVMPLPHGLHARPAARIVALLKTHAAAAVFEAHGRTADACSMVAVMALGVRQGDELTVRATGTDAAAAVEALVALIEGGMGEAHTAPGLAPALSRPAGTLIPGIRAAPGFAVGTVMHLTQSTIAVPEAGAGPAIERAALDAALATLGGRLAAMTGLGSEIAAAHAALLDDPGLSVPASRAIAAGSSAGAAWRSATQAATTALQATGDPHLAERVADLADLEHQLLALLYPDAAATAPAALPDDAVVIAADVLPSQFIALDHQRLAGIATAGGGPTSHVAILAAAAGLPMLVAGGTALLEVAEGQAVILDADGGWLDPSPDAATLAAAGDRIASDRRRRPAELAAAQAECRMADGTRIEVFANLSSIDETARAVEFGAEGCGLLRTEFLFLGRDAAPDEDEQAAAYAAIATTLGDRPLIVRTLDIGGDKPVAYLPFVPEDNPALGNRGVRFSLARPDLLDIQLRAILRGVPGDQCRIMVPMVVAPAELAAVSAALDRALVAVRRRHRPQLGVMVETPSAAVLAGALARDADFLSIGSNDLTQYALAADRGNPATAALIDALNPAVLRLIALAADGAAAHRRWLGVCGGIASDPAAAAILIGLGVTELSCAAGAIPAVKARVRTLRLADCRALAVRALACSTAAEVRALAPPLVEEAA
ncbi:phosphoenolpyruvate--protein phosphotransferase [Sphingosinicellaceae bacterium]|nr:phosphoenolpyruvate--protein phosphotransferase [Sphingosinicellaceae bacterium]